MGNDGQRNFQLESRSANVKTGANSFQVGGTDTTAPILSVGDAYSAAAKLAIRSYTSLGTNALTITVNATISGCATISGNLTASTGITITKGTTS